MLGFGFRVLAGVGFMLGFGFQAWLLGLKPMGFGFRPPHVKPLQGANSPGSHLGFTWVSPGFH